MVKRILFVNEHLHAGGVERALVDILRHWDYVNYNVDLLLLNGKGDYIDELPSQANLIVRNISTAYGPLTQTILNNIRSHNWFGIKYRIALLATRVIGSKSYKYLARILGVNKTYDTAIAFRIGPSADIIAYGITSNKKLCWWHHGAICDDHPTKSWLGVWQHFDKLVTVSNGVKDILANLSESLVPKLVVIPNMVDVEQICEMGKQDKNPYIDSGVLNFVTVGRIVIEKHIENVVKAAVRLRADGRLKFKWHIIGDGDLFDDIAQMIHAEGISEQVILCGRKPNPYPYIKYADMMVHTSHIESQGLVIQEAMALGTPCVVTRSVGPSEFIIDGENGVMVEPTVESLIEGIYRLADNRKLQEKIIANGQTTLTQGYTPKVVIEKIVKLIEE